LATAQALQVLGVELMEKAAELEKDRILTPPEIVNSKSTKRI